MALFPKVGELSDYLPLLSLVGAITTNVLSQVVLVRVRRGKCFLRSIVEGFSAGVVALGLLNSLLIAHSASIGMGLLVFFFVDLPTYGALSYCYFTLAYLGQSSIRIRMYSEIASVPSGVSVREMSLRYDDASLLEMRLQRLIESGDIVERDGRFFVGRARLVRVGNIIVATKHFLLGKKSEFE
jgi:hypothetical protein